mmetsp:Transcript_3041/g.9521  ORF Transcript_3041/g.9521 Transcript_3041/m.9521 type:complete len:530 (+) Transcript_3041:113-1702(+)|eukprot:CAMPEP_0177658952 /NCGR_PEP_ID=MMETSP0447-20121125/17157_1 /TAXON_ID=0 /ORGANISM="Stygamoeba regulata, Strain BSH-02190019" /LENGTH=529 /DNA_ID=CAMNT_0019163737 /DNA_START=166 /DNA_END=1755 /DNA_ORIENTATION=-
MSATPAKVLAQFRNESGEQTGPPLDLPATMSPEQLNELLNELLQNEETLPYSFYVNEEELSSGDTVAERIAAGGLSTEQALTIVYVPQSVYRVRAVTRCTATLEGHTEAVLVVAFSPDGQQLVSGSGDHSVRFWDLNTQLPSATCKGHRGWVLCAAWSPDTRWVATGGMDNEVRIWRSPAYLEQPTIINPAAFSAAAVAAAAKVSAASAASKEEDSAVGSSGLPATTREERQRRQRVFNKPVRILKGHRKPITAVSWEPAHIQSVSRRLVSASKDGTVKVWDTLLGRCLFSCSGHSMSVTCVRWGGAGMIYTGSQDRKVMVYSATDGKLIRVLTGHGHWVNTMALSTDYALRTGAFDHHGQAPEDPEEARERAEERYLTAKGDGPERLVTGSDDHTMYLWHPTEDKKPIERLTGHIQLINVVSFSPDGRLLASASFDKSVKIWDGKTGKFIGTLRGHVGAVYQVCWSNDSRMILSGSRDTTLKLWDLKTRKLKIELPGHADEVYSVDWSPNGSSVASGSKDRTLKIWRQ